MSRENFCSLGGFDEHIQTNEDYELCQRAWAVGLPVTCVPELAVIHWGTPQSLRQFFRKYRWHGTHVLRVFLKNLPALYNLKPVAFALYTLVCLVGILAGTLVAIGFGRYEPLLVFSLALMAPPVALGIRARHLFRSRGDSAADGCPVPDLWAGAGFLPS